MENSANTTNRIPQVDRLLRHGALAGLEGQVRHSVLAELARRELATVREVSRQGQCVPDLDTIAGAVAARAKDLSAPSLTKVVNGTGIVLNTNLGRAPLPRGSLSQALEIASGYSSLEIDLETGRRGRRGGKIAELISVLTGCESALVVNNNAAALMLAVATLARDREVIVSRGELIEIGGSFRLPEVITGAGGLLREVGTTNRTRSEDYRRAISASTGLILKCHRSNFAITGFTEDVQAGVLVGISRECGVPFLEDLGSGLILPDENPALAGEPSVKSLIDKGVDLVSFSGDKLLGGPQCGILAGRKDLLESLRANPLFRALRPDKVILSILENVLAAYLTPAPEKSIPVLAALSETVASLDARVRRFIGLASTRLSKLKLEAVTCESAAGGGSLPDKTIASAGVQISCTLPASKLAAMLRRSSPPVVAIVHEDRLILDFRTIPGTDEEPLLEALAQIDLCLQ